MYAEDIQIYCVLMIEFLEAEGALGALNSQAKGPHVDGTLDSYSIIIGRRGNL